MKKILLMFITIFCLTTLTGCKNNKKEEFSFKDSYEKLNGQETSYGGEYRSVSINEKNPYFLTTAENIVSKIESGETFYIYFGDEMCPWCRSVIEKSIESANKNQVDKIYYVKIWDESHNEILRDKYVINNKGTLEKVSDGTESYYKLLEYFNDFLSDYTLTNNKGESIKVGEKRIMAPNFVYVEKGKVNKLITGISNKQEKVSSELTQEIQEDQLKMFDNFFQNA